MPTTVTSADAREELLRAARIISASGLSDAFGHVSMRLGEHLLITSPAPLAFQREDELMQIVLDDDALPPGVPKEAWIHVAIARADASVGAVCRAQPRGVARAIAADRRIRPLDGQSALLGASVPVHDDSRLIRDSATAVRVSDALGAAPAIVLRGNGAVTRGPDLASAVARMWLLDRSADLASAARTDSSSLPDDEQVWWRDRDAELLPRIYDYLVRTHGS